ncbi:tetratricopeptide repeat protein [Piscinibacter sakaiensis]|uniref:Uncharacterized protein n=1 Tax=Piscinibacter sakaiensis TaxID=1547922 RepID=A0A0K8P2B5_PISS1|nr:tetratricopeptide repeat protein [Piscinibacter sakaiensis]GAP36817.1 hypothetical protein ISF6_2657 [Piscinibacter sakaiensis]
MRTSDSGKRAGRPRGQPLLAALLALGLGACASPPPVEPGPFQDAHFAAPAEPPEAARLFALDAPMRAYADGELAAAARRLGAVDALAAAMLQRQRLEYDAERTRTAAEAFEARAGNCLSLVLLTAAFAKHLGLPVYYRRVRVDDPWRRSGDLYVTSGHVNVALVQPLREPRSGFAALRTLTIDFLPPQALERQRSEPLDEATLVGMYMNNRAAEALAEGRLDAAYWWAREAVRQAPAELAGHNTLAVVYLRRGLLQPAEALLRRGLARDPDDTRLLANLVLLLERSGRSDEARATARRLLALEGAPPQHDYRLGLAALAQGRAEEARRLFEAELARAPDQAEVHFALARAEAALGHLDGAREQLRLASERSLTRGEAARYAGKLARLAGPAVQPGPGAAGNPAPPGTPGSP